MVIETSRNNTTKLLTFSTFTTKNRREVSHRFPTEKRHASVVGCFSEGFRNAVVVEAEQMKQLHFVAHSRHSTVFKDVSHNF